jgi:hypothetical protein
LVADQQRGDSKDLLTEREREALQELAKSIVREAGLAQDPEHQAELEQDKARFELVKTLLLLNAVLLGGMGAVAAFLPQPEALDLLRFGVYVTVLGLVVTNFAAVICHLFIGRPHWPDSPAALALFASSVWFSVEAMIFVLFLIRNIYPG